MPADTHAVLKARFGADGATNRLETRGGSHGTMQTDMKPQAWGWEARVPQERAATSAGELYEDVAFD